MRGMRGVWFVKSAMLGLGLTLGFVRAPAVLAQSLDIPLQLAQSSDGVRLIVNIGIAGQAPRSYLFDTGSSLFNAAYSPSAFGAIPSNMSNVLPTGVSYNYTSGNTYTGNLVSVPSLTFYPTSSPTDPGAGITLNAVTPGGTPSGFTVNAVYARNGVAINSVVPLQTIPGVFGGIYGIFGAGDYVQYRTGTDPNMPGVTPNTNTVTVGSVLGQAVVSGTTAGYVVAANGQPLAALLTGTTANPGASVNGPQVGQSVTSCSPCVMLGLTPALLAQFKPMNTLAWTALPPGAPTTFPNSNAPSSMEYGINMNYSVSGAGHASVSWSNQPTLLDTGTTNYSLNNKSADVSGFGTFDGATGKYKLNQGTTLTIAGTGSGASVITNTVFPTASYPYNSPYGVEVGAGSNNNIVGIPFFLQNSVLFNLAGQAVGYTSNFVTDTNIVTTPASPLEIGSSSVPLGLAGIISGAGGVFITSGGSATLSGANTYTGVTSIVGGMLALAGPGSIAPSSGVAVSAGGLFDISGTTSGATIKTLSGDANGLVALGAQTLTLSNASTTFNGVINGVGGGLQISGGVETLAGVNTYTGATTLDGGMLLVNGSIISSNLTAVDAGGTLGGTGVVGATTIAAGGTLMPGLPGTAGGTLTVTGNLVMASAATYLANVSPSSASLARITGTAALGGSLDANGTGGAFTSGARYPVLTATGGVGGGFSTLAVTGGFGSMVPAVSYDANDVFLTLGPADLASSLPPGAPRNVVAVANAITAANVGTPPLAFQNLFDLPPQQLQNALAQLSGETATGAQKAALDITNDFMGTMFNPYAGNRGAGGGFGPMSYAPAPSLAYGSDDDGTESAFGYAKKNAPPKPAQPLAAFGAAPLQPRWSIWGSAYGGQATVAGDATVGSSTTTTQVAGYAVGADYRANPDTIVGVALAGGSTSWSLANGLGGGNSNVLQLGGFASSKSARLTSPAGSPTGRIG